MVSRWWKEEPDVEQPVVQMGPSINYHREVDYGGGDTRNVPRSSISEEVRRRHLAEKEDYGDAARVPGDGEGPFSIRPKRNSRKEPKPSIGTIEKVIEEVEELCEAHVDEDPALVLTEVADVIGALMCYVLENYPKTDFDALVRRAKAKNKAKGNKK